MLKTFLFFGLGNPGQEYSQTFHNAGWQVLDEFVAQEEAKANWKENKKVACLIFQLKKENHKILLAKPLSFMNLSGLPFKKLLSFYKIDPAQAIIVHDDADLPLGELRFSFASGSGGHKGVQSIFHQTGHQNLHRLRIGIGRPENQAGLKNFVLKKISATDQKKWKITLEKAVQGLFSFYENGPDKTATLFNGKNE